MKLSLKETLEEVITELECDWDLPSIRYQTVMNLKEWNDFINHPERKPYKSKLNIPQEPKERYEFGMKLLKKALDSYKKMKSGIEKEKIRGLISTLLNTLLHSKYEIDEMRLADNYVNRKNIDRDNGKVDPTEFQLHRFDYAIKEYCRFSGKNFEQLKKKIDKITNGRPSLLSEYYSTCQIDDEFRLDIQSILNILSRDYTQSYTDLQRSFEVWKQLNSIGLDLDSYLELLGYPNFNKTKILLEKYLAIKEDVAELKEHLKDEFPKTYKEFLKSKSVDRYIMLIEETKRKNYPTSLRTEIELKKMVQEAKEKVYKYLPLAEVSNPRFNVINAKHPASTRRAFQSSVKNINGEKIFTTVMTPRVDDPNDYLSTFAHESTHALHGLILDWGEKSGILEKSASQRVTQPVMEVFSTLVDDLFSDQQFLPYKKKYTKGKFPNYASLFSLKFQAIFALVQLSIADSINTLSKSKEPYLKESIMSKIILDTEIKLENWIKLGLPFKKGMMSALSLFDSYSPDDGLRYIKTYITERKATKKVTNKQNTSINLPQVFKNKYGKFWLDNKEARIILHWLLLETGRNLDVDSYSQYVLAPDLSKYKQELKAIGIDIEKI